MAKLLVTDELWNLIAPLLPEHLPGPKGGHPRVDDRVCLAGIVFVLKSGIPWEDFPQEMGCCGMTLWNRVRDWQKAGVWQKIHELLLAKLRGAEQIDFSRVIVDSGSVRAVLGGQRRAQILPIGRKKDRNIMSSSMPAACRWRQYSPALTVTT
jgi:transposase